ncbi:SGNH/GDSL hydrolase family protein [Mycobacterium sp. NPDC006124]|uniref:SGNH/GDSL hydrolase family protein n=1 Tax=Mycobacterium sp. NPDC006124 TaxID=3156729 RepID=UPI0033BA6E58
MALALLALAPAPFTACSSESAAPPPRTAVFIGDSYTAGDGGGGLRWTQLVADREGWQEVNLARGGTAFEATSDAKGCGLAFCPNYGEMIPEAVKSNPDVVVISGGRNDASQYEDALSARREFAAIEATFDSLRGALPNAEIYAVSPVWDDDPAPNSIALMGRDVQAAVTKVGGTYLDIGEPLAGRPDLMSSDGVHPNDQGYRVIAIAVGAKLNQTGKDTAG